MRLPEHAHSVVKEWLRTKFGGSKCPECSSVEALLWPSAHVLPVYGRGLDGKTTNGRLVVVLECLNCGGLRFFSARALGLAKEATQEDVPKSDRLC